MENTKSLEENAVGELLFPQHISREILRQQRGHHGDRPTADPLNVFV